MPEPCTNAFAPKFFLTPARAPCTGELRGRSGHVPPAHQHQPRRALGREHLAVLPRHLQRHALHARRQRRAHRRLWKGQLRGTILLRHRRARGASQHRVGEQLGVQPGGADGGAGGLEKRHDLAEMERLGQRCA